MVGRIVAKVNDRDSLQVYRDLVRARLNAKLTTEMMSSEVVVVDVAFHLRAATSLDDLGA